MPKTIQLTIPDACVIPEIIATFSPEEVFLMLKIGGDCLREGRNALAGMSQIEIYNKIKDESKEEIRKIELDLVVQREMTLQMEDKIRTMYTGQVEQIKRQLDITREQLKNYEAENRGAVQKEVDKIREKKGYCHNNNNPFLRSQQIFLDSSHLQCLLCNSHQWHWLHQ